MTSGRRYTYQCRFLSTVSVRYWENKLNFSMSALPIAHNNNIVWYMYIWLIHVIIGLNSLLPHTFNQNVFMKTRQWLLNVPKHVHNISITKHRTPNKYKIHECCFWNGILFFNTGTVFIKAVARIGPAITSAVT